MQGDTVLGKILCLNFQKCGTEVPATNEVQQYCTMCLHCQYTGSVPGFVVGVKEVFQTALFLSFRSLFYSQNIMLAQTW